MVWWVLIFYLIKFGKLNTKGAKLSGEVVSIIIVTHKNFINDFAQNTIASRLLIHRSVTYSIHHSKARLGNSLVSLCRQSLSSSMALKVSP